MKSSDFSCRKMGSTCQAVGEVSLHAHNTLRVRGAGGAREGLSEGKVGVLVGGWSPNSATEVARVMAWGLGLGVRGSGYVLAV